jgi:hypothetical protein
MSSAIAIPQTDSTTRLQHCLSQTLRWLFRQQLITGEMPAYRRIRDGETFCYPSPLISALAFEALASADPRASAFSRRLYDVLPVAERKPLTCGVVTARWRLRCYVASQEFAEGRWRLYGREAGGESDAATSAIGAAMLWQDRGANVELGVDLGERLLASSDDSAFAQAAALRLLSIAGENEAERGELLLAKPMTDAVERAAVVWMLTESWRAARNPHDTEWPARLLDEALSLHRAESGKSRLCAVLVLLTLMMLNHRGSEVESILHGIVTDPQPPWRWPQEPVYRDLSSPALTAALTISAFASALDAWREIC